MRFRAFGVVRSASPFQSQNCFQRFASIIKRPQARPPGQCGVPDLVQAPTRMDGRLTFVPSLTRGHAARPAAHPWLPILRAAGSRACNTSPSAGQLPHAAARVEEVWVCRCAMWRYPSDSRTATGPRHDVTAGPPRTRSNGPEHCTGVAVDVETSNPRWEEGGAHRGLMQGVSPRTAAGSLVASSLARDGDGRGKGTR